MSSSEFKNKWNSLQEVSDLLIDPSVERCSNQVRPINNMSINGDLDRDGLLSAAQEFDERWPHQGKLMRVSGWVHTQGDGYGGEYLDAIDDRRAVSYGFGVNFVDGKPIIGHQLGLLDQEHEGGDLFGVWADPQDIFLDPVELSPEKAAKLFEYHYPEIFSEIESRILNSSDGYCETKNEIDIAAIESLSGLVIEHDKGKSDSGEDRDMISKYIEHMLPLDHDGMTTPYSIAFRGICYPVNPETGMIGVDYGVLADDWLKYLAVPARVILIPSLAFDLTKSQAEVRMDRSVPAVLFHVSDIKGGTLERVGSVVVPVGDDLLIDPNADHQKFDFLD